MVAANGFVFFLATDGVNGAELWKSDGTASGTVMVKDKNESIKTKKITIPITTFDNGLYFISCDSDKGKSVNKVVIYH